MDPMSKMALWQFIALGVVLISLKIHNHHDGWF